MAALPERAARLALRPAAAAGSIAFKAPAAQVPLSEAIGAGARSRLRPVADVLPMGRPGALSRRVRLAPTLRIVPAGARPAAARPERPMALAGWPSLYSMLAGALMQRSANSLPIPMGGWRGSAPFSSTFDLGAAAGLPASWAAYPLPAGQFIGQRLAALVVARGEAWGFDGVANRITFAGKVLVNGQGEEVVVPYPAEATQAEWADSFITKIVAELAAPAGFAAVLSGAERAHWLSVERIAAAKAAGALLRAARRVGLDPGRVEALNADAVFLLKRS